ncbi:MAG: hypothetical protein ABI867_22730 [Kofleriaceae bacterium]
MRILILVLALTAVAHADRLADARRAIDEVHFDQARALLVAALEAGGATPAELRQLYELSAQVAIVLNQRELGEQYYRRWLALDPAAALPAGSPPKLADVFVAAKAYMAAHGRLAVKAERTGTAVAVVVEADPLAMASAASLDPAGERVTFTAEHRATLLPPGPAGVRVVVLDDRGNQLVALDVAAATAIPEIPHPVALPLPGPRDELRPILRHWLTWGIPAGGLLLAGAIVGVVAFDQQQQLKREVERSGENFFPDTDARHDRVRREATIAIALAGAGAVLAIPATIFFIRSRRPWNLSIVPQPAGMSISGRF